MKSENNLEYKRHTLAHILASVCEDRYDGLQLTLGPAIENGFYYDIDFRNASNKPNTDEDLHILTQAMEEKVKKGGKFTHEEVSYDKAKEIFANNKYKLELIEEINNRKEKITIYTINFGDDTKFVDLCRGGHCEDIADIAIGSFKLDKIAGAYWRGDEKRDMLTRIYGLAFETADELTTYVTNLEEAKKRDHRTLGKQLELFTFSDIVGAGLPIWLPKGATLRRELERFIVDTELKWGYLHVYTPDIAKIDLYKKSGHYPYYKESMYAPIKIDEDEFMLRPMTCPHHFQVYSDSPKSYRDLPMRIAELAKLYRYEASGELTGLVRVRGFCLADAHIICADKDQAKSEVAKALDLIEYVADVLKLSPGEDFWYRLSLGDRNDDKKYYKNDSAWDDGEQVLREVLQERKCRYYEAEQEAAFYGPKIDIQMKDVKGKENTAFTVQYDFCMPDRFELEYTNNEGQKVRPLVVHRSSIGAIERIVAFLIEHTAGAFPLWLAPVQVKVIPIKNEAHLEYAQSVYEKLKAANIRVELDDDKNGLGKKVRHAKDMKYPYWIVIGDAEVSGGTVTLESREGEKFTLTHDELLAKLSSQVIEKK